MSAYTVCCAALRNLVFILLTVSLLGCAGNVSLLECQVDADCAEHPAALGAIKLHCTKNNICVLGTPLASLCAETYPPSSPADAIAIGALVNRDFGNDYLLLLSYKLAIDEINKMRGPSDTPIVLRICEINADREDALKSMKLLATEHHVVAVVGPSTSQDVIAIKDEVMRSGIPIVSPAATAPEVTMLGEQDGPTNGLFYRVIPSDTKQGPVMAKVAINHRNATTARPNFAMLHANDAYGYGLKKAILPRMTELGYLVRPVVYYDELTGQPNRHNIDQSVESLLSGASPYDIIVVANNHSVPVLMSISEHPRADQIRTITMSEAAKEEDVLALYRDSSDAMKSLLLLVNGSAPTVDTSSSLYNDFLMSFIDKYKISPNATVFTGFAYDAIFTIALAIGAAPEITPRQVRSMLARLDGCLTTPDSKLRISVGRNKYVESRRMLALHDGGLVLDGLSGEICFTPHGDRVDGNYEQWWIDRESRVFRQKPAVP